MIYIITIPLVVIALIKYWLFMSPFSQTFGAFPYRGKTNKKVIALTFDDGPNKPFTNELLDFLKEENVKATFFMVGVCVNKHPELAKRAIVDGHVIGNHSYSHKFTKYFTDLTFDNEIAMAQQTISSIIGKKPALFRPPWLLHHPWILKTARKHGLVTISGEFSSSLEVAQVDGAKIANTTIKKVRPGSIIIFHDGFDAKGGNRAQTIAAVKLLIPKLKADGYSFITVDKLLNIAPYQN